MKLEDIVTSLEISKRLKEFGVRHESIFSYIPQDAFGNFSIGSIQKIIESDPGIAEYVTPCFTASELMEMLPHNFKLNEEMVFVFLSKTDPDDDDSNYYAGYSSLDDDCGYEDRLESSGSSLANAAAKMLIYLIENGHMDVKDL